MAGAEGVLREWLEGSSFEDYFLPSLVLFAGVGGSLLAAAIAVFAGLRLDRRAAITAGLGHTEHGFRDQQVVGEVDVLRQASAGEPLEDLSICSVIASRTASETLIPSARATASSSSACAALFCAEDSRRRLRRRS